MTLKEVAVGSTAKVKKITGAGPLRRRIMDMGITKGGKAPASLLYISQGDWQLVTGD